MQYGAVWPPGLLMELSSTDNIAFIFAHLSSNENPTGFNSILRSSIPSRHLTMMKSSMIVFLHRKQEHFHSQCIVSFRRVNTEHDFGVNEMNKIPSSIKQVVEKFCNVVPLIADVSQI